MKDLLLVKHTGPLTVTIITLDKSVHSWKLDFKDTTLFDYIGNACARIFTNLTTKLSVEARLEDWEILKFSREDRILKVKQIGGEPLRIEEDDTEKLAQIHRTLETDPSEN